MKKTMLPLLCLLAVPGLAPAWEEPLPPPGLVMVEVAGVSEMIWPFTGRDYSGDGVDPINLVLVGNADPRMIRQALLALDGNRAPHFPDAFPFNCTWTDAIGSPQTGYSEGAGWQGSAVQLECGDYALLRTHLRLFRHGPYTLAGAHFEVQIPGTSSHEVLSWEVPRDLVALDLLRTGLVAPEGETPPLTPSPWRTIRHQVFNTLPLELRAGLGLPLADQDAPVPIPNDGRAKVFAVGGRFEPTRSHVTVEFDHPFGQAIPKPFCSSGQLVYVSGSVHMTHRIRTTERGRYAAGFEASGTLQVVPINLLGQPIGPPFLAQVSELHRSRLTDARQGAFLRSVQVLLTDPEEWLVEKLWAGKKQASVRRESCGE